MGVIAVEDGCIVVVIIGVVLVVIGNVVVVVGVVVNGADSVVIGIKILLFVGGSQSELGRSICIRG